MKPTVQRSSCRKTLGQQRAIEQELQVIEARIRMMQEAASSAEQFCRRTCAVDDATFARVKQMFTLWAKAEHRLAAAIEARKKLQGELASK